MAKKPRSQRRRAGGKGGDGSTSMNPSSSSAAGNHNNDAGVEFLSESHTIVSMSSSIAGNSADGGGGGGGKNNNNNMMEDDPSWGLEDGDDGVGGVDFGPSDQALQAAEQRHGRLVEALSSTLSEFAAEKRSARREQYLKIYFRALTQYAHVGVSQATLDRYREELWQACLHSMRIGAPSEQYAACRVLEASAIVYYEEEDDFYRQVHRQVQRLITSAHRAIPVRIAALRALGMAVLMMSVEDDAITESVLDICEGLVQPEYRGDSVPSSLRAAAFQVWTVLSTTIHELYVAGKDDVSTGRGLHLLPLVLECLEQTDDLGLRAAAGECMAWIHTARMALGVVVMPNKTVDDDNHSNNSNSKKSDDVLLNTTEKKYQEGSWEGSEWEDLVTEIEAVMDQLSNQSGHYMSKKAKKEQRANFREYLATLQDNEPPLEVLQFRGGSLELTSWKDVVVVQFLRRCLQGGFQLQLLTNPAIQELLGANGQVLAANNGGNNGLSQLEKRLYMSKTSEAAKLKDIDLTKKRDKRQNIKNHFLTADGDDI